ncbi:MAG: tRNA (adenosine(37)-N6)-dimethylallyltransferase MiaA [Candidatus Krumholzibacteria bacterium]|nr:tRNA (adenosine(37)-N6)-dimethylallyltransferase MiaA [Candidatus Krumholzibacteria bacterium]
MITAVAILGPTASGKSRLGMELARRMGGEILSVDSRQVYRRIDIGTAKPDAADRGEIPHHLIDIIDLQEKMNAELFAGLALAAIRDVASRGKLPILVGGSGLYFRGVAEGFFDIELDPAKRVAFAERLRGVPNDVLHARLAAVDPESAERIHCNDRYRVIRSLEVQALTGKTIGEHMQGTRANRKRREIDFVKMGIDPPRLALHRNIEERTLAMIARGWPDEVKRLLADGAEPDWPGMKTLGYPQMVAHVRGETGLDETVKRILELTRQYAKRQVTWFKKEPGMHHLAGDEKTLFESAQCLIRKAASG